MVQIVCWTGQFIGHGVFEVSYCYINSISNLNISYINVSENEIIHFQKRAPALLDNLIQAFVMGPFFVLLEVLYLQLQISDFRFLILFSLLHGSLPFLDIN